MRPGSGGQRVVQASVLVLGLLLSACSAAFTQPESPPGPGVPRIANLRFEPDVIRIGESTQMSFYFEVGSADLHEGFVIERGISEFQFFQVLQPVSINLERYEGQVAGTVEVPLKWSAEGLRFLEVYVVTRKGNTSNRIRANLTVR
ncbi:MAG: hypothetical protein ACM362_09925 [Candidatus Methylomirabilota bacterium]|nr:hypothetical protein [Candidatus Methylomirabilis sp.]